MSGAFVMPRRDGGPTQGEAAMAEDTSNNDGATDTGDDADDPSDSGGAQQQLGDAGQAALKAERERARKADRELKAALAKLKAFEDRDKSDAEKLAERATAAEKAAADAQSQLLRFQVAAEKGLPAELAGRLQGADAKELAADADKLLELFAAKQDPAKAPVFNGGPRKTAAAPTSMNDLIRSATGRS